MIIKSVKSHIEDHEDYPLYQQSKASPQSVSEILRQYKIVSGMLRELSGLPLMDCNEAPGMVNAVKFTLYLNSIGLIFLVSRLGRPWPGFDLGQELS